MDPFEQALGDSFKTLPKSVQAYHRAGNRRYSGHTDITRGHSLLGGLMLRMGGFPPAGEAVPLTVTVEQHPNHEVWTRDFNGHIMQSTLRYTGAAGIVEESFGPLTLHLSLSPRADGLYINIAKITLFGWLKAPRFLLPKSTTFETDDNGNFHFFVTATAFMAGRLIRYEGTLKPI